MEDKLRAEGSIIDWGYITNTEFPGQIEVGKFTNYQEGEFSQRLPKYATELKESLETFRNVLQTDIEYLREKGETNMELALLQQRIKDLLIPAISNSKI